MLRCGGRGAVGRGDGRDNGSLGLGERRGVELFQGETVDPIKRAKQTKRPMRLVRSIIVKIGYLARNSAGRRHRVDTPRRPRDGTA